MIVFLFIDCCFDHSFIVSPYQNDTNQNDSIEIVPLIYIHKFYIIIRKVLSVIILFSYYFGPLFLGVFFLFRVGGVIYYNIGSFHHRYIIYFKIQSKYCCFI